MRFDFPFLPSGCTTSLPGASLPFPPMTGIEDSYLISGFRLEEINGVLPLGNSHKPVLSPVVGCDSCIPLAVITVLVFIKPRESLDVRQHKEWQDEEDGFGGGRGAV